MRRILAISLALLGALYSTPVFADGAWLDRPFQAWNQAGRTVPIAPAVNPAVNPMCLRNPIAPTTLSETAVTSAGWRLVRIQVVTPGNATVVIATADYDGMCRPTNFNAFTFVDGSYAGTLSPVPMVSRLDGTLSGLDSVTPADGGRLNATFLRYSPSDPLCCPSLPAVTVEYRVDRSTTGPVVVPVLSRRAVRSSDALTHLPRTGEFGIQEMFGLGLGHVVIGLVIRLSRRFFKRSPNQD